MLTFCPGENRIEFQTPLPRGRCAEPPRASFLGGGRHASGASPPRATWPWAARIEPEINVHPALRHEPGTWTYDAYLAVLAEDHGDQAEARRIWRKVFDACSDNPEALSRGEA